MEKVLLDGMGAIVGQGGVTYRVWAPHAQKVFVTGSFNDWQEETVPLTSEDNGYWAKHVEESKEGDEYKFVLNNGESKLKKNDPYAKKTNHSDGNSIVSEINLVKLNTEGAYDGQPFSIKVGRPKFGGIILTKPQ